MLAKSVINAKIPPKTDKAEVVAFPQKDVRVNSEKSMSSRNKDSKTLMRRFEKKK